MLNVTWNNDTVSRSPFLFLPDSCQCPKWYRTEFDLNVLFIHLLIRNMPFYALAYTLRSKVDLIWTRAIRIVIAQSVQFSEIAKKLNIYSCQYFSH